MHAQELAARHFGLEVTARELPSYVDQNFRLTDEAGPEFVLKVMNSEEDPVLLEAQVAVLDHLRSTPGPLETPRVVRSTAGPAVTREGEHPLWLVTYLPGRLLADVSRPHAGLLRGLGVGLGDLDGRLAGLDHPALRRTYRWDLRQAPAALSRTGAIADAAGREAVRSALSRFETEVLPEVDRLPFQVIHNDANDHNLVVDGSGKEARATGLLDFGDLVWTARVCESAIAMTYVMFTASDPLEAGALLLAGYHEALPLRRREIRAIPHLIEARLCVSVTMSAHRRELDPTNAYLSVSEASAWALLDRMFTAPPVGWIETLEDACASARPIGERSGREQDPDEA